MTRMAISAVPGILGQCTMCLSLYALPRRRQMEQSLLIPAVVWVHPQQNAFGIRAFFFGIMGNLREMGQT